MEEIKAKQERGTMSLLAIYLCRIQYTKITSFVCLGLFFLSQAVYNYDLRLNIRPLLATQRSENSKSRRSSYVSIYIMVSFSLST